MNKFRIIILSLFALFIPLGTISAFDIPSKPENNIYDPNGYLSNETKEKLIQFNKKYKDQTELAVVVEKSIDDSDIATKIAQDWQFNNDKPNAVLVISMNEQNMAIKISDKLKEVVPRSASIDIYHSAKSELNHYRHDTAVQTVINGIEHKIENPPANTSQGNNTKDKILIAFSAIVLIILIIPSLSDIAKRR